jgi:cell division protease FtsH
MVTTFGMSDKLGPRTFGNKQEMIFLGREVSEQKDYSERFALEIDKEVNKFIAEGYHTALRILTENKPRLVYITEKLVVKETLEGKELESVLSEPVPTTPPEAAATPAPTPATATAKAKTKPAVKKAPAMSQLLNPIKNRVISK